MKTTFQSSFAKDLRSIKDQNLRDRIAELIQTVEPAGDLSAIPNLKKLRAVGGYYRVRLGDYNLLQNPVNGFLSRSACGSAWAYGSAVIIDWRLHFGTVETVP